MKNTMKASEIIRKDWDCHGKSTQTFEIDGKIIKTNLWGSDSYWNGNDIPEKYTRAMGGVHYKAHKSRAEELDDCIALGYDEIRFVLYASKMIRGYCDVFVWACNSTKAKEIRAKARAELKAKSKEAHELAQTISQMDAGEVCAIVEKALDEIKTEKAQNEAQESSEDEAKEINQPEPEMATESKPEHHRIILASFDVSREQIDAWNRLAEAVKGTSSYYVFSLWHEYKDVNGRWQELSHGTIRSNRIELEGERFYVRKIKDNFWLYWEYRGEAERWLLSDLAKAYFDVREVD